MSFLYEKCDKFNLLNYDKYSVINIIVIYNNGMWLCNRISNITWKPHCIIS